MRRTHIGLQPCGVSMLLPSSKSGQLTLLKLPSNEQHRSLDFSLDLPLCTVKHNGSPLECAGGGRFYTPPLFPVAEKQYHLNKVSGPKLTFSWWSEPKSPGSERKGHGPDIYSLLPSPMAAPTGPGKSHGDRSRCALFSQLCMAAQPPPPEKCHLCQDPSDSAHRETLCMGGQGTLRQSRMCSLLPR